MGEDGVDIPSVGTIRFVGDDMFTFDGTTWRPIARVPDSGANSTMRDGAVPPAADPADEAGNSPGTDGPAEP